MVIPAKDDINALRIRPKRQRTLDEVLAGFEAIVSPTLARNAPRPYAKGVQAQSLGSPRFRGAPQDPRRRGTEPQRGSSGVNPRKISTSTETVSIAVIAG